MNPQNQSPKYEKLGESLQGYYSIDDLVKKLQINRAKAIYIVHRLRELGFVKTTYVAKKKRLYYIALANKRRGISYTEKINEAIANPGINILSRDIYYIHGRTPSYEEALIYALKQQSVRYIIASLAVFRKISDWSCLYRLAKKESLLQAVAALYEVARKTLRVRRMPKRFLTQTKKRKSKRYEYIVQGISSDDFKDIEKRWNTYIPLNRADLEEYRR